MNISGSNEMQHKKYLCWSSLTDSCDHVTKKNVRLWGRLKSGYQNGVIGKKNGLGTSGLEAEKRQEQHRSTG